MRNLLRLLVVLALGWVAIVLYLHALDYVRSAEADHTKIFVNFLIAIAIAIVAGTIFALTVIPMIGNFFAESFYNPNEVIEKDPHAEALALAAQGDFEGATASYRASWENDSTDTLALSEAVLFYCEKLHDPASGAEMLESALGEERPAEETEFIASRLVDVYWKYQRDAPRARALLVQIAETMPDTRFAANAHHRLHEIDQMPAPEPLLPDAATADDSETA